MIHSWKQWLRGKSGTSKLRRDTGRERLLLECLENRWLPSMMFTVNSAGDDPSGSTAGAVTFRDAINAVNSDVHDQAGSPDVINFNISGAPAIALATNLPALTKPVTIDGSTQAGVTVNGNNFAMLVDNSAATLNDVTFTGGTATLGANSQLTVSAGSTLSVTGDLNAGNSATLKNYGSLSVSGNFVDAGSIGVYNAPFSYGTTTFTASFAVGGAFTAGSGSAVDNNGTATFNVAHDFSLGEGSFVNNGRSSADAATLTVGGNFSIGDSSSGKQDSGFVNNYGMSTWIVNGNFIIYGAGGSSVTNGFSSTDAATLTVGGSFSMAANSYVNNNGTATFNVTKSFALGDYGYVYNGFLDSDAATLTVGGSFSIGTQGYVYNYGASALTVTGDFTLGDDGFVYNGVSSTDAATLSVGGNFSSGTNGFVYNYGMSALKVAGNFSLGDGGYAYNGTSSTDAATLTAGGSFSIGYDGYVYNQGTSVLGVTGSFSLGDFGSFYNGNSSTDAATLTVGGSFTIGNSGDGSNDSGYFYNFGLSTATVKGDFTIYGDDYSYVSNGFNNTDATTLTVGGSFSLGANSSVYNNGTSTFSLANSFTQGANSSLYNFGTSAIGGSLTVTGSFYDYGTTIDSPAITVTSGSVLTVEAGGTLVAESLVVQDGSEVAVSGTLLILSPPTVVGSGQINTESGGLTEFWTVNPVNLTYGNPLDNSQLSNVAAFQVTNYVNGEPIAGTFAYTPSEVSTVLDAGPSQNEAVTFTPSDPTDLSASGVVIVNVTPATPIVNASSEGTTYNGLPQAYPLGDVSVTGVSSGDDQTPSGTFSYSYAATGCGPSSTPPTNAGTYTVTVTFTTSDPNYYTGATATASFTIGKASSTTTAIDAGGTYNGSSFAASSVVTGAGVLSGTPISITYVGTGNTSYGPTATAPTNAGTYAVTASYTGDANHNGSSSAEPFAISMASSTTTVIDAGGTYNGSSFAASSVVTGAGVLSGTPTSITYVGTGNTSYGPTATAPTNAGTYAVTASYAGDANHTGGSSGAVPFIISMASSTTTATDAGGTYNGSPFAASGTVTGAGGLSTTPTSFSYVGTGNTTYGPTATAPTNAGTYAVTVSYTGDANHNNSSSSAEPFAISMASSTTTVIDAGGTYNGSQFAATGTVTGAGGLSTTPTSFSYVGTGSTTYGPTSTAPTNAGTYAVTASYAGDTNHTGGSSAAVPFIIGMASSTTTVIDAGGTYNGSSFAASSVVTGAGGLSATPTSITYVGTGSTSYGPTSTAPTNAGTYTVTASYAGDANHNGGSSAEAFAISLASSTTTVIDAGGTYNGSSFAASGMVTGAGGLSSTPTGFSYVGTGSTSYGPTATAPTCAGTYSVTASYTGDANHNGSSSAVVLFTIQKATPTITWNTPGAITYSTPLGSNQLDATANVSGTCVSGTCVYTPAAGTLLRAGINTLSVKFAPTDSTDYVSATAESQLVVLGPGVTVIGTQLYIVGGNTSNDQVQVSPYGSSGTGSTGVTVNGTTYNQSFTAIDIVLQGGNDNIQLANSLTLNAVVTGGSGNDNVTLGNGNNTVTLGNGNDKVTLGNGTNTVTLGNGNDNVQIGNSSYDDVTLGTGNDNVQIGNGSFNTVTLGTGSFNTVFPPAVNKGHDNVKFGTGSNNTIQ